MTNDENTATIIERDFINRLNIEASARPLPLEQSHGRDYLLLVAKQEFTRALTTAVDALLTTLARHQVQFESLTYTVEPLNEEA